MRSRNGFYEASAVMFTDAADKTTPTTRKTLPETRSPQRFSFCLMPVHASSAGQDPENAPPGHAARLIPART
jgi:hypothetical protein